MKLWFSAVVKDIRTFYVEVIKFDYVFLLSTRALQSPSMGLCSLGLTTLCRRLEFDSKKVNYFCSTHHLRVCVSVLSKKRKSVRKSSHIVFFAESQGKQQLLKRVD